MVDEYQQHYMSKEGAGLKNTAGVMLTALEDALKYPSVAEDSGTPMRTAQYLATRTVNAFGGAHEWSLSLMVYALLGNKSYVSSETFWYVFPRAFVAELQNQEVDTGGSDQDASAESKSSSASEMNSIVDMLDFDVLMSSEQEQSSMSSVTQTIEELANSDELPQSARAFKIDGKTVFVTEVESYKFRGKWFLDYSPTEFASIVDIMPRKNDPNTALQRGRKRRKTFGLDPNHPLYHHYEAVIRVKFLTPMFGGASSPSCPRTTQSSKNKMDAIAKTITAVTVPWSHGGRPEFDLNKSDIADLCALWDNSSVPFLMRQRYRQVHNFIQKRIRSNENEKMCLDWRARNASRWKDNHDTDLNDEEKNKASL
ncbi:hypothetical protein DVH05_004775 [Phytophthora capsici]|nr:hypothetical protein DVH05_004775 [Phytophthora capsici]